MSNRDIARVLGEVADLLDIKGDNAFRIRSYRMGAEAVAAYGEDAADMLRAGKDLRAIEGVGAGIAAAMQQIVETGTCDVHRELLAEVPGGLLALLEISGFGPKGVSLVWRQLGVRDARDLEAAIADGRLRSLPGMKEKKEARILAGLQKLKERAAARRFVLTVADEAATRFADYLAAHGAARVVPVGSFRRGRESIGDLDLIVVGGDAQALGDAFVAHPDVREVLGHGAAKSSVVLASGLQVDLRPFAPASLGAAMQYFTGSKAHNVALRERAQRRGLKLNEYGVFRVADGVQIAGATEEDVYAALGLPYIPPEMREDRGEIAAAEAGALPKPIELGDVRGDLHSHTTESDGQDSLADMAAAARSRGLEYLAVTEHSRAIPSRAQGTGMDETRCLAHVERCRALQKTLDGLRVLAGIEVDILPDGSLDMASDVLAKLDLVVAAVHSGYELSREAQTERLVRALSNPQVHVWGHPLSRRIPEREPLDVDLDRLLDLCVSRGVALEINGQPQRLDFPDHLVSHAREKGVQFVLSTDSHAVAQFSHMRWAVAQARRGWLTKDDVLNARPVDELLEALRRTRP